MERTFEELSAEYSIWKLGAIGDDNLTEYEIDNLREAYDSWHEGGNL